VLFILTTAVLLITLSLTRAIAPLPPTEAQMASGITDVGGYGGMTLDRLSTAFRERTIFYITPDTTTRGGQWLASWNTLHWTTWLLVALLGLVRLFLRINLPTLAVARLTLNDAIRQRLGLWPVIVLVVLLSLFPLTLTRDQPLRYQVQTYLQYSFLLAGGLLSVLTILLASRSVSSDLTEGHVANVFTKPLGRLNFLAGKFVGMTLLNVVLVTVSAFSIYVTTIAICRGTTQSESDAIDLRDQVLSAREKSLPAPERPFSEAAENRLNLLIANGTIEIPANDLGELVRKNQLEALIETERTKWKSVGPQEAKTYVFSGLAEAKRLGVDLQFRLKGQTPSDPPDKLYPIMVVINNRAEPMLLRVGSHQILPITSEVVDDKGELRLTMVNRNPFSPNEPQDRMSLSFTDENAMQILFPVTTIESNFWRAVVVLGSRIFFITMLACVCGALLSFPVAAQLAITVWLIAAGSGYISDAMDYIPTEGPALSAPAIYGSIVTPIIKSFTSLLSYYGTPDAAALLADGQLVSMRSVYTHMGIVGALWSILLLLLGWGLFSRRELARVTV